MSKWAKENIFIIILLVIIGVFFYYNVDYYDRFVLKKPEQNVKTEK